MGGVDDNEPPTKRVKASSFGLGDLSNTLFVSDSAVPLGGSMARPLPSEGEEDLIGSKGVIKRVEFVRIITKALYSLGYERSGAVLEEESGINLHTPVVNLFRKHVLDGNWDESVVTLHKIGSVDDNALKSASFLILEQKFFEFLEKDKVMDALKTLRSEIAPLGINKKRVHELSNCIVSPSQRVFLGFANLGIDLSNSRLKLLEELQKLLPPTIMIPERRLEHLIEQALDVQRQDCYYHNSMDASLSLYADHQCGKDQIPSQTTQVLQAHHDEVWFLQFSNSGRYLASSSKDKSAIIWEILDLRGIFYLKILKTVNSTSHSKMSITEGEGARCFREGKVLKNYSFAHSEVHDSGEVIMKHKLAGHERPVLMVAWSPDDCQILTCGMEETVRLWDANSGECMRVYQKSGLGLNSCGWFPDGKRFFSGVTDMSICLWDVDGKELECWKGQRTLKASDMAVTKDGKRIISICRENVILLLDREAKLEKLIEEEETIISFSLSNDNKFLLVNLLNQKIHLWSIVDDPKLVTKYKGHKRERYVIRSCFGGLDQAFIASGSEDSQVYIWHRHTGKLVQTLPGHSGTVNCVTWNPANPHMLASGSDDHTIRLWGLNRLNLKRKEDCSNGTTLSNGSVK